MNRSMPDRIRKRDGRVVPFEPARITEAVFRAAREAGHADRRAAARVTRRVVEDLATRFRRRLPTVEDAQDSVERALVEVGSADVARAYVLYRQRRADLRDAKRLLGVRDELKLSLNAAAVLKDRYLLRDAAGQPAESTGEMMDRVARHVAQAEDAYGRGSSSRWADGFARMLRSLDFLPNSPTLMNAGTSLGLLSGCFVLPVGDSLDSIFDSLKVTALVHQAGGGTGFSFSHLRPEGDVVASTRGVASGPLSFMRVFDVATDVIRQGGRRRGANMAVLDISHPDIAAFVDAKVEPGTLENFNLSVAVTDAFMRAVLAGGSHRLVNPRTGRTVARVSARELFDQIASRAHRSGDPGLLFVDRLNRANPVPALGRIEATNPCGEVPLLPNESCNLGSVNLARFVTDAQIDWERLGRTVRLAVRFLDDVIDVNRYPVTELERAAGATRKIGLGVMGLAELLATTGVPYDSTGATRLAGRIARYVGTEARRSSVELAVERGAFPEFPRSRAAAKGSPPTRNAQLTSIAPTGTISIIAGTTSGIEPMFAIAYVRNVLGTRLVEANPLFERIARARAFWSDDLIAEIATTGGVRANRRVPVGVRRAFVTALEIAPEWHLRMQAAVQRHVDAAVSKTVNLPADATIDDVREIYLAAWKARAKGITVYRYGSKAGQVLTFLTEGVEVAGPPVQVEPVYAGGCAAHACEF